MAFRKRVDDIPFGRRSSNNTSRNEPAVVSGTAPMKAPLLEVAGVFLRLGAIGFGGPAAHIAMMEDEAVGKRSWLTRESFLKLVGATNIIPGPNSTEMAIHIGFLRAGWLGLIVAGASFILPAVLVTGVIAWSYGQYGALPSVEPFLRGTKPAVLAIIAAAAYRFGKTAFTTPVLWGVGAGVLGASLAGVGEIVCLATGGLAGTAWTMWNKRRTGVQGSGAMLWMAAPTLAAATGSGITLAGLGLSFLKIGAVLYGSGYVLVAFLQGEFVDNRGWLTQQQLLDAIAVGQFTPGPVLSTATFVGFQILGIPGAIVATAAIFLPSFVYVALLNPILPRLQRNPYFTSFLDAVTASSVALIMAVTVRLSLAAIASWTSALLTLVALACIVRFNVNSVWIVLGGAVAGWAIL